MSALRRLLPVAILLTACGPKGGAPTTPTTATSPSTSPSTSTEAEADEPDPAAAPAKTVEIEPLRIDVVTNEKGSIEARAYDARTLLDDGNDALMQRRFDEALASYEHLLADFPDSQLVVPAIYNAGLALEGKRDFGGAAARYRKILTVASQDSVDYLDAQFRLGRVLVETAQHADVEKVMGAILERKDLRPEDRVEALAWLGLARLEQRNFSGAEETFRIALAYYREENTKDPFDDRSFAAMCQYHLAEIPDRQFREVPLRYPEAQLQKDLEHKSDRFLLAQDRYIKTVDFKDPFWATKAVYRIGLMYKKFWDDWMAVPIPADLTAEEAKEYIKQVNEEAQLKKLLEKSLLYHERNITMARNGNVTTEWSEASKVQADAVRRVIAMIQRGEYITPGPEASRLSAESVTGGGGSPVAADYMPPRVEL